MTAITKLALQQANTALAQDNTDLRALVAKLEGDIERITSVASAVNQMPAPKAARPAYVPPEWQVERAAAMAAARAAAMQSGRCVKA